MPRLISTARIVKKDGPTTHQAPIATRSHVLRSCNVCATAVGESCPSFSTRKAMTMNQVSESNCELCEVRAVSAVVSQWCPAATKRRRFAPRFAGRSTRGLRGSSPGARSEQRSQGQWRTPRGRGSLKYRTVVHNPFFRKPRPGGGARFARRRTSGWTINPGGGCIHMALEHQAPSRHSFRREYGDEVYGRDGKRCPKSHTRSQPTTDRHGPVNGA